jgi:YgiT-type zinc finger domain-containing protein
MKCIICKHGCTAPGTTTITLTRDSLTLVIRGVPADVCETCGEAYVDESITEEVLRTAEDAARAGVLVEVRDYVAA